MKPAFWVLVIFIYQTFTVYAQMTTFSKIFSNIPLNPENGWNVVETPSGYLLLSANECLDAPTLNCSSLIMLDFEGNIQWFKTLNQSLGYQASHIALHDDKIILSGQSNDVDTQFALSYYDMDGNFLGDSTYGDVSKEEWPAGLILKKDNDNIVLYGNRDRNQNHRFEWLPVLMKINLQGDTLMEFTFNEQYDASSVNQVIESTQHDLIASYVYCPDGCFLDLKAGVTCLDSIGDIKWVLELPYSYAPRNCLVSQLDSNTLAVKWHIESNEHNYDLSPPAIFFTDMSGVIQDTFIFRNQSLKEVNSIEPIWEKGLVGCGSNFIDYLTSNKTPLAGWVFRMDESRQITWDRTYVDTTYNGSSYGLNQIIPTSDGGYIAVGTITNQITGVLESHNWVLKLDAFGCLKPGCGGLNYVTKTEETQFPKSKDIKMYPNPASTYVNVELPSDFGLKNLSLYVSSNIGTIVKQMPALSNMSQLNLSDLIPGIYYVIVAQGNEVITSERIVVYK